MTTSNRVNAMTSSHKIAFHFATHRDDRAMTNILLEYEAHNFARDNVLKSFVMIVVANDRLNVFEFLLRNDDDFQARDFAQQKILHFAIRFERIATLIYILNTLNCIDFETKSALNEFVLALIFELNNNSFFFFLNLTSKSNFYVSHRSNILTYAILNSQMTINQFKMLLKRVRSHLLILLLNSEVEYHDTSLYAICIAIDSNSNLIR